MSSTETASTERRNTAGLLTRGLALVAVVAFILVAAGCGRSSAGKGTTQTAQADTAASFFAKYLTADGRVTRTDQGGDTVSEAQAYGLLIAVGAGDSATFGKIWTWTRVHLQRADHLLAWHWVNGKVIDATPAADADVDAAVALLQAADQFKIEGYRTAGIDIANAVLTYETVTRSPGSLVVAGPWATANPATINPSYLVSGTASYLAAQTGNAQWRSVATATTALDHQLAADYQLPPDWALLGTNQSVGAVKATGAPDKSVGAQYGLDAVRLIIRLAASCSASDRALAKTYLSRLGEPGAVGARSLTGKATVTWHNAATDVALYAANTAAGNAAGAHQALTSAQTQNRSYPTYYGAAWTVLGPLMFGAHLTETCS